LFSEIMLLALREGLKMQKGKLPKKYQRLQALQAEPLPGFAQLLQRYRDDIADKGDTK
jgi:hypothetical protein